jgi:hypothetical protein
VLHRSDEVKARRHYRSAKVDGTVYELDDDVYVRVPLNSAFDLNVSVQIEINFSTGFASARYLNSSHIYLPPWVQL